MPTTLHLTRPKPSPADPTTTACYNLALETFSPLVSFSAVSWQRRINAQDAMLFTASLEPDPTTSAEHSHDLIIGFLLTSTRQHPELPSPTLHISLAAVAPSHRRTGIFPRLLAMAEVYASSSGGAGGEQELGLGLRGLSICTLPAKFEGMYQLLADGRNGWVEVGGREIADGWQVLFWRGG